HSKERRTFIRGVPSDELDSDEQDAAIQYWKDRKQSENERVKVETPDSFAREIKDATDSREIFIAEKNREVIEAKTALRKAELEMEEYKRRYLQMMARTEDLSSNIEESIETDDDKGAHGRGGADRSALLRQGAAASAASQQLRFRTPDYPFKKELFNSAPTHTVHSASAAVPASVNQVPIGLRPSQNVPASSTLGRTIQRRLANLREATNELERGSAKGKSPPRSVIKPQPPSEYDGKNSLDVFQRFVEEACEYLIEGQVTSKWHVQKLRRYLTKEAEKFYKQSVKIPEDWTIEEFFLDLFNHCFDDGFMGQVRRKFNTWVQKESTVKSFASTLEGLREDLGEEISDFRMNQRLWEGLRDEITECLYHYGLHPDYSSYEVTLASAIQAERAVNNTLHRSSSFSSPTSNTSVPKARKGRSTKVSVNTPKVTINETKATPSPKFVKRQPRKDTPKMSEEERQRHIDNGLCWNCSQAGHLGRNCPERQKTKGATNKPPGKTSYAVRLPLVEDESVEEEDEPVEEEDDPVEIIDELRAHMMNVVYESDTDSSEGSDTEVEESDRSSTLSELVAIYGNHGLIFQNGLDYWGNPPDTEIRPVEPRKPWDHAARAEQLWHDLDYLRTRGIIGTVIHSREMYKRLHNEDHLQCPEEVLNHEMEKEPVFKDRFGDPVQERIERQMIFGISRLPHLWQTWQNEPLVASCMTTTKNDEVVWLINDPLLSRLVFMPMLHIGRQNFDFVGWYQKRTIEFVDLSHKYEKGELDHEDIDYYMEWNENQTATHLEETEIMDGPTGSDHSSSTSSSGGAEDNQPFPQSGNYHT
ncbi:hypothetical protein PUNSTDRAFT_139603, partial [Punctularia strigosozonata HHB-11173 SS5]